MYVIAQGVSLAVLLGLVPVILVAALTDLSLDRWIVHSRWEIDLNLRPNAEAIIKGLGAFICVSYRGGKDRGAQAEYMAKFLVVYAFAPLIALRINKAHHVWGSGIYSRSPFSCPLRLSH